MTLRKPKKLRLDELLVQRGAAETTVKAQSLIMAGLVVVAGTCSAKAGQQVCDDVVITIKEQMPYVSRGGIKLAGALDEFKIFVKGRV